MNGEPKMDATDGSRGGLQIRHTHPYGFRAGEWADVLTKVPNPETGKDCYIVRFPDGVTDWWRVTDPDEPYEFRNTDDAQASSPKEGSGG